jgi:hypothetical protein
VEPPREKEKKEGDGDGVRNTTEKKRACVSELRGQSNVVENIEAITLT